MARAKAKSDVAPSASRRYPYHRGPFIFAPHFLSEDQWFEDFRSLIERVLDRLNVDAAVSKPLDKGRNALISFTEVALTIDGDRGTFCIDTIEELAGGSVSDVPYPMGLPREFLAELDRPQVDVIKKGADYRQIKDVSELLYGFMERRFDQALRDGYCQILAQVGSPLAETTTLQPWQMEYLTLRQHYLADEEDHELDEAEDEAGVSIFGIGVVALQENSQFRPGPVPTERRAVGHPVEKNYPLFENTVERLLAKNGLPDRPNWNLASLFRTVKSEIGEAAPGRTEFYRRINPLIETYKIGRKIKAVR